MQFVVFSMLLSLLVQILGSARWPGHLILLDFRDFNDLGLLDLFYFLHLPIQNKNSMSKIWKLNYHPDKFQILGLWQANSVKSTNQAYQNSVFLGFPRPFLQVN